MKINLKYLFCVLSFSLYIIVSGCNNNPVHTTTELKFKALTERDFADVNLKAEPGAVVVLNLEDLNSPLDPEWYDTDVIGIDIIPIKYSQTAVHNFRIGENSFFRLTFVNESTNEVVFELTPMNAEINIEIPSGNYLMVIESLKHYGSDSIGSQTVFIQPDREIVNSGNVDYEPSQLNTLLSSKNCVGCNLAHADLKYARLDSANISYSDLSYANLSEAILIDANLSYSVSIEADLSGATMSTSNLSYANFYNANFAAAILISTNLSNAQLNKADFGGARLRNANFTFADLTTANLSAANLRSAQFYRARLNNASLRYSDLTNANLSYANLKNADFCHAILNGIISTGVVTDSQTQCWPNLN